MEQHVISIAKQWEQYYKGGAGSGENEGHPFRGNQWTDGQGGSEDSRIDAKIAEETAKSRATFEASIPPYPEGGSKEDIAKWDDQYKLFSEKRAEWRMYNQIAIAEGKITIEDAEKRGVLVLSTQHDQIKEMPSVLWHVTTAASDVAAEGLKTRDQLSAEHHAGLGGGPSDTISFTDDPKIARGIYDGVVEGHKVARGEITVKDMLNEAEKALGANKPYYEDIIKYYRGGNWEKPWVKGVDPIPETLVALMEGMQVEYSGLGIKESDIRAKGGTPTGDGWMGGDKEMRYVTWKRPMDEKEKDRAIWSLYNTFATFRDAAGGAMYPLFFGTDPRVLAERPANEIKLLRVEIPKGRKGYQTEGLREWRTWSTRGMKMHEESPEGPRKYLHLIRTKGDLPGHPFRGNQWTTGESTATPSEGAEKDLHGYLTIVRDMVSRNSGIEDWKYKGMHDAVLKLGKYYKPAERPEGIMKRPDKLCFQNATELSSKFEKFTYVEGFAIPAGVGIPMHHAWCVDEGGNVVDPTWRTAGTAYFGIPFTQRYLWDTLAKTKVYGMLPDMPNDKYNPFKDGFSEGAIVKSIYKFGLAAIWKGGEGSGEQEGHPFRGNQWTDGQASGGVEADSKRFREHGAGRTISEYIRDEGTYLDKPKLDDVADYLEEMHAKEFGGPSSWTDPVQMERAVNEAIKEHDYQIAEHDVRHWYDADITDAYKTGMKLIPQLADKDKREFLALLIAVSSPQQDPITNMMTALEAMKYYVDTGSIPTRPPDSSAGWVGVNSEKAFTWVSNAVKDMGEKNFLAWVNDWHDGAELNAFRDKYGRGPESEIKITSGIYSGSYAFGPKVGPFYRNINQIDDVTVDLWMVRAFNRHFGIFPRDGKGEMTQSPTTVERRAIKEWVGKIADKMGNRKCDVQAVLWYYEQHLWDTLGTPSEPKKFSDGAKLWEDNRSKGVPYGNFVPRAESGNGGTGKTFSDVVSESRGTYADGNAATGLGSGGNKMDEANGSRGIGNLIRLKYDDDQPRDSWGRWVSGGDRDPSAAPRRVPGSGLLMHGTWRSGPEEGESDPVITASDRAPDTYFHGTSTEALESIMQNGISPQKDHNWEGAMFTGDRKDAVFVTSDKKNAMIYGMHSRIKFLREMQDRGTDLSKLKSFVAIVRVKIPSDVKLEADAASYKSYYMKGRIPPQWINSYDLYDFDGKYLETTNLRKSMDATEFYVPILFSVKDKQQKRGLAAILKGGEGSGENEGHPFRGNQYTDGTTGGDAASSGPSKPAGMNSVDVKEVDAERLQRVMQYGDPDVKSAMEKLNLTKPDVDRMIVVAREYAKDTPQTRTLHVDASGKYNPQRQATHDNVINGLMGKATMPGAGEKPLLFLTGGLSGSGKSTMISNPMYDRVRGGLVIDADEIRAQLAKADGIDKVTKEASSYQDEVDDVIKNVWRQVMEKGCNVTYDCTMKTTDKTVRIVDAFKKLGYKTEVAFAYVPLEKAMSRAVKRYIEGGRFVDPVFVASQDHRNLATLEKLKEHVDVWKKWDMDVAFGTAPKLMDEGAK